MYSARQIQTPFLLLLGRRRPTRESCHYIGASRFLRLSPPFFSLSFLGLRFHYASFDLSPVQLLLLL